MQTHRFRPWIVISFTFLLSSFSVASSVVETEYELKLPRVFQQTIIDKLWTTLQREVFSAQLPIPDQQVSAVDTEVLLSGITMDFQTQLRKPAVPSEGPTLVLESREMTARLKVQSISVDQYIVREIGGVVGRFHLQARCENLDLLLNPGQGQFKMRLSPVFTGPRVSSRLEDMEIGWSKEAWTLNPMNCTGAQGFEDIITEHVLNMTRNSEILNPYKPQLMEYVQKFLDTKSVDISKPRVISSQRSDIQYSMRVNELVSHSQTLLARGVLSIQFRNAKNAANVYLPLGKSGWASAKSSSLQLRVPEKLLEILVEKAFVTSSWTTQLSASQVPGFASLWNSRFVLCLIWPELDRYSPNAPFSFQLAPAAPLQLSGSRLNYRVEGALAIRMLAPKVENQKTRLVPFMNFHVPLQSDIKLSLTNGRLAALFTNVNMGLQAEWAEDYVQTYRPQRRFAAEKIRERLVRDAQGKRVSYELPRFQIMDAVSLRLQSVSTSSGNDLVFTLK